MATMAPSTLFAMMATLRAASSIFCQVLSARRRIVTVSTVVMGARAPAPRSAVIVAVQLLLLRALCKTQVESFTFLGDGSRSFRGFVQHELLIRLTHLVL
jgi:hypothetical protein